MLIVHGKRALLLIGIALWYPLQAYGEEAQVRSFAEKFKEYIAAPHNHGFRDTEGVRIEDVEVMARYMVSADEESRGRTRYAVLKILEVSRDSTVRRDLVDIVIRTSTDDEEFVGILCTLPKYCVAGDFTPESKRRILLRAGDLTKQGELNYHMMYIFGVADIREALPLLDEVEQKERERMRCDPFHPEPDAWPKEFSGTLSWVCLLTRARWGDEAAMDKAIELIDSLPTEQERIQMGGRFLPYTLQRKAVEYLRPLLYSDVKPEHVDEDVLTFSPAVLLAGRLHGIIPGFPWEEGRFDKEQLKICRQWMKEHEKNYKIEDLKPFMRHK